MISNNLTQGNIQLTIIINFISYKDGTGEERVMLSKSENKEIIISDEADEVTQIIFDSRINRYQNNFAINER